VEIPFNIGSLVSQVVGWIYPEELSVFSKDHKDRILALKSDICDYIVTIYEIEIRDLEEGKYNPFIVVNSINLELISKCTMKHELWKSCVQKKTDHPIWILEDENGLSLDVLAGDMLSVEIWDQETLSEVFLGRIDIFPYLLEYYKQECGEDRIVLRCNSLINHHLSSKGKKYTGYHHKSIKGTLIIKMGVERKKQVIKQDEGDTDFRGSFVIK